MKKLLYLVLLVFVGVQVLSAVNIEKIQPSFWWSGMKDPTLQVLLYGKGIGVYEANVSDSRICVQRTEHFANKNYLILYLNLRGVPAESFKILLTRNGKVKQEIPYELKQRSVASSQRVGFNSSDVLYLLMPDRFSNGNPANDVVAQMRENKTNRNDPSARHGGDLLGVMNHLDYLHDLGITALWMTPVLENDMPSGSYHGYAITDYYAVDKRFGENSDMKKLTDEAHRKGIKMVMDMVFNHCGSENFLFKDSPAPDWFNFRHRYVQSSYQTTPQFDIHASEYDKKMATDGWFTEVMPDWNQRNADVAKYLIQNSIWWIEYAGIDGIRQDTHPYADFNFMAAWCRAIEREYPGFNIVGETWLENNVGVAFWQKDSRLAAPRNSYLPTVMDFPLSFLMAKVFDEPTDKGNGLSRLYGCLSQDIVFQDPLHLLVFLDNHDMSRFFTSDKQTDNFDRFRQAYAFLLTVRGIPEIYYGDEIMMFGDKAKGDGDLRKDFPGGWQGDRLNAFDESSRSAKQNAAYHFMRRLLQWRKNNDVIAKGSLTQFLPQDGVYVYQRSYKNRSVVVVLNGNDKPCHLNLSRYREIVRVHSATNVLDNSTVQLGDSLSLKARDVLVLEM